MRPSLSRTGGYKANADAIARNASRTVIATMMEATCEYQNYTESRINISSSYLFG